MVVIAKLMEKLKSVPTQRIYQRVVGEKNELGYPMQTKRNINLCYRYFFTMAASLVLLSES